MFIRLQCNNLPFSRVRKQLLSVWSHMNGFIPSEKITETMGHVAALVRTRMNGYNRNNFP